jgi:N-acetylmuramoyl-L-alanine amidase
MRLPTERSPIQCARHVRGAALVAAALLVCAGGSARADGKPIVTVVIDPGHGGSNLGAPGHVEGVHEKKLTLAVARLLRKRLERDGVNVIATRDADVYLTLAERVRRANAAGADVFVSLHANATPDHRRRGFDTFVLSREVRDIEANVAGHGSERTPALGASGEVVADPVDAVLSRARVRLVARESARLSRAVRAHLGRVRDNDRGSRQAPYDVLDGLRMPATLIEVGFIDHPDEGTELLQPEVMHRIADAIADGIEEFAAPGEPR